MTRCLLCEAPVEGDGYICDECDDSIADTMEEEETKNVFDAMTRKRNGKITEGFRIMKGQGE